MTTQVEITHNPSPSLVSEWGSLWEQDGDTSLFCQPAWLLPWWQTLGAHESPRIISARQETRLTVVAPLCVSASRSWGEIWKSAGHGVSDYADWLLSLSPIDREWTIREIVSTLSAEEGWTGIELSGLRDHALTQDIQRAFSALGANTRIIDGHICPFVSMPDGFEPIWQSLGSRGRYNIRSREKRLGSLGAVRYLHADRDTAPALLERAIALHARRWEGQHTSTVFSSSAIGRGFYRAALPGMVRDGTADIAALTLNDEPIAIAIGFLRGERYHYYLPAWEPSYAPLAPSTLLLVHLLRFASEHGARVFDFMLGDEEYKRAWATGEQRVQTLLVGRSHARSQAWIRWRCLAGAARERARGIGLIRSVRRYGLAGLKQGS